MVPSPANDNNLGYESLDTIGIVIYHQDREEPNLNLSQLESHFWDSRIWVTDSTPEDFGHETGGRSRCSPYYGEAKNRIHRTQHPVAVMLHAMTT